MTNSPICLAASHNTQCSDMALQPEPNWLLMDFTTGALPSGMSFNRGSAASYFDASGTLQLAATNAPRFDYDPATLTPRGLLLEESRSNSIANNWATGAVAGTPGTLPSGWAVSTAAGLATYVVGTGTEGGMPYVDLRMFGTTSATGYALNLIASVTATAGQTWTGSVFSRRIAGSTANITSVDLRLNVTSGTGSLSQPLLLAGTNIASQRTTVTTTCGSGTVNIIPRLSMALTNGAAVDITVRIGCPQLELGAYATSVIKTTGTAATRSGDVASMTSIGTWFNPSEGTLIVDGMAASTLANMAYAGFSDTTSNNRVTLRGVASGSQLGASVLKTGTAQATLNANGWAGGQFQRFGVAWRAANFAMSLGGGAPQTATSGSVPAVTQLELGRQGTSTTEYLCGWLRRLHYVPQCVDPDRLCVIAGY